jgi:hypothetical protein
MNYAELTASTSEMIRRMMIKNTIETAVLGTLCLILIVLTVIMIKSDRKVKKVVGGYKYGPTVTDAVQYDQFGTEYHRMGVAGRR